MNFYAMGDYYVWYCDWCDTKNITFMTQTKEDALSCGACHSRTRVAELTTLE